MLDKLVKDGRKLVTIIDPHSKVEEEFFLFQEIKRNNIAVKASDGEDYITDCWPKESVYYDFLNPEC